MEPDRLDGLLRDGDALIIVPPFAGLDRPSLAAHLLQASAAERGFEVRVLYASLLFAAEIGESAYVSLSYAPTSALLGERTFAAAAYGVPPLGRGFRCDPKQLRSWQERGLEQLEEERLYAIAAAASRWADELAAAIARRSFPVVGCTTTFEQTAASIALLDRLKELRPETVTLLGGANCDGEMAHGIRSLGSRVDFVFSGESEQTFPAFLEALGRGELRADPIVIGEPCMELDSLPTPRFGEFYEQLAAFVPDSPLRSEGPLWLPYETSRGCWWGAKRHCTFCGLNAQTMTHREKSPARVLADLGQLLSAHPTRQVCMVDNIMPHSYFQTLLPRLAEELPGLAIFYEQKANLSLNNVLALKRAGVHVIQPGIEALSSSLLTRMRKGVSAVQNLALLRYARSCDLALNWNLLYGFPGDSAADYQETLALLPLLAHLNPPGGLYRLSIDRFSPYFDQPRDFGVGRIEPLAGYASVLPDGAAVEKVAYHFTADYASGIFADHDLLAELESAVARWQVAWGAADQAPPSLALTQVEEDLYLLFDSRQLTGTDSVQFLDREQAAVVLRGGRPGGADCGWALERKLLAEVDSRYVPLVTAEPDLLKAFEASSPLRPAARPLAVV